MQTPQNSHYHIFSLPTELLNSLTPRNLVNRPQSRVSTPEPPVAQVTKSSSRTCNVCQGIEFLDLDQQRVHFRSDWHRYNVKTRINGGHSVSQAAFSQLLDGLEDSLSGSASSDEDDDSDAVSTLVNRTKQFSARSSSPDQVQANTPVTPLTWFHSPPSTQLGIYRALFPPKSEPTTHLEALKKMQTPVPGGRRWAMFMVAGGHFAGAIVRVSPLERSGDDIPVNKKKTTRPQPDNEVLFHKTFHRYTTRKKQGGSQSTNDNAKGFAKSAGALLRRYGEQALRDDIRGLLSEWADEISNCETVWVRASISNRRIFYDYENAVISKADSRLRTFPFPTRRPTQSELSRCLLELTRAKISHLTEDELRAQDEAYLASLPKPKPAPVVHQHDTSKEHTAISKLSKEEEVLREKWNRLLEIVSKGRLDSLKLFLDREQVLIGGVDAPIPMWSGQRHGTILQLAAASGHEDMTRWLLEEAGADPTIPVLLHRLSDDNDGEGLVVDGDRGLSSKGTPRKVAYDVAKSKSVRDVFRRCAASHPERWDWLGQGHVPSILSQELEQEQDEKRKVRRKGLKERVKEREAKEKEMEESKLTELQTKSIVNPPASDATSNRLGGLGSTQGIAGLSPEMRAKVERERRARAAEARLRALGNAT